MEENEVIDDAPAEGAAPEADAEAQATESEEKVEKPSDSSTEKNGVQERIDELTRFRREAERDRDYWRDLAMKHQPEQPKEEEPVKPVEFKTLEDFDYDEGAYQRYMFDTVTEQATQKALDAVKQERAQGDAEQRVNNFRARMSEYATKVDDYYHVVENPALPMDQKMIDIVQSMESGPEIVYHLGKNIPLAQQIAKLSPIQAAVEIGRIEAQLQAEKKAGSVSKAPPPAPKIEGTNQVIEKDPDSMTMEQWLKWRGKNLAKH